MLEELVAIQSELEKRASEQEADKLEAEAEANDAQAEADRQKADAARMKESALSEAQALLKQASRKIAYRTDPWEEFSIARSEFEDAVGDEMFLKVMKLLGKGNWRGVDKLQEEWEEEQGYW